MLDLEKAREYGAEALEEDKETFSRSREELLMTARALGLSSVISGLKELSPSAPRQFAEQLSNTYPRLAHYVIADFFSDLEEGQLSEEVVEFGATLLTHGNFNPRVEACIEAVCGTNHTDACSSAEEYFVDGMKQIKTAEDRGQCLLSVYHDADGVPVLLRKEHESSTAITLEGISLSGLPIVPGTIVGVNRSINKERTGHYEGEEESFIFATYALPTEVAITPLRLSPWVHDNPLDRALFARMSWVDHDGRTFQINGARADVVVPYDIEDFRKAAHQLAALCGVTKENVDMATVDDSYTQPFQNMAQVAKA